MDLSGAKERADRTEYPGAVIRENQALVYTTLHYTSPRKSVSQCFCGLYRFLMCKTYPKSTTVPYLAGILGLIFGVWRAFRAVGEVPADGGGVRLAPSQSCGAFWLPTVSAGRKI